MAKRIEILKVIENKILNNEYFILTLFSPSGLPEIQPGQFAEIKVEGSPETFLRRPFSIHDIDYEKSTIKILIQIAGKGTNRLSKLNKGDNLDIIYPLGNSFSLPESGMKPLLAGGGCGIAPLLFLAKYLRNKGFAPEILLGFRNAERIIELEEYQRLGNVFLTTDDGSSGVKGFLHQHPALGSGNYDIVYVCGPEPMMKAVAKRCSERNILCEVSLENLMGCGIGACLCCVAPTVRGNLCTCIEGPVFNSKELLW